MVSKQVVDKSNTCDYTVISSMYYKRGLSHDSIL
jgi:hypothetical protein